MSDNNKPIKSFKSGLIEVSCWENSGNDNKTFISLTITRSYQDKDDQWQKTNQISGRDAFAVAGLMTMAGQFVVGYNG